MRNALLTLLLLATMAGADTAGFFGGYVGARMRVLQNQLGFPIWDDAPYRVADYITALSDWTDASNGSTDTATTFGSLSGTGKWLGGVLAPNGMIYGMPFNSTTVLKIDPSIDTATTFGSLSGTVKWIGGVLAPNGMIYGIPADSATVLKIDPSTDTATTFGSLSGLGKWIGGVLAPNGMIYGIPFNSTTVLKIDCGDTRTQPDNWILSAPQNKL